jgi:hypothetical protein
MNDKIKQLINKASDCGKRVTAKQQEKITRFFEENTSWVSTTGDTVTVCMIEWIFGKPYIQFTASSNSNFKMVMSAQYFINTHKPQLTKS